MIRLDDYEPCRTARTLSRPAAEDLCGVAIMAPETPQIRDVIHRMRERGIQTIPFVSNQQEEGFVGIDSMLIGVVIDLPSVRFR